MRQLVVWIATLSCAITGAQAASFTPLGFLQNGNNSSVAWGVSDDGSVVVGRGHSSSGYEAFRWTATAGMQGLGDLPSGGFQSEAFAVSGDGTTIVGFGSVAVPYGLTLQGTTEAFRWTNSDGIVGLGLPPAVVPRGLPRSSAWDVSTNGSVVVGYLDDGTDGYEAFRWTQTTGMVGLGALPGESSSAAWRTSADGNTIVGYAAGTASSQPFRWTSSGGMVGLGHLPGGNRGEAIGVSANGSIVVGASQTSDGTEAFLWTEAGGMVSLGELPGGTHSSTASAVSADGSIVIGKSNTGVGDNGEEAIIWTPADGMQLLQTVLMNSGLDLAGWTLKDASDISPDGRYIVGWGYDPLNQQQAFLVDLTPVPLPAAAWFLGGGLGALGLIRRKQANV